MTVLVLPDSLVHQWLCEHGLINLIVTMLPAAQIASPLLRLLQV